MLYKILSSEHYEVIDQIALIFYSCKCRNKKYEGDKYYSFHIFCFHNNIYKIIQRLLLTRRNCLSLVGLRLDVH